MMKSIGILLALLICAHAFAEEVEVPEEELARESVLPVFNKRRAVLNRNVLTVERFEIGLGAGLQMSEPFYNTFMGNGEITYNFTETSAVNIQGLWWSPGLSSYGNQLKSPVITGQPNQAQPFDASKAPHPYWAALVNYEYIAYYGKISITKRGVMNLNTFGLIGAGYINMTSGGGDPAFNVGIGQNFFFTHNIGLRWNLRYLIFQGPDATSQRLTSVDNPSPSSFGTRIFYNPQLDLGLVFIL